MPTPPGSPPPLHQAHDELLKLALHDSLTRLPNRLLFADRLEQRIQECQHSQRSFSPLDPTASRSSTMPTATTPGICCWPRWPSASPACLRCQRHRLALWRGRACAGPGAGDEPDHGLAERLLAALAQPYEWSTTACTSPPASALPSIPRMAPACTSDPQRRCRHVLRQGSRGATTTTSSTAP